MAFGKIKLLKLSNKELANRNILVHPPEPPLDILMSDPTNSIYIGRTKIFKAPFYWNYENITNPHIAIVGISGSGKSYFIKTFLLRAAFTWQTNAIIMDWAGEYKDWVRQTGGKIISLGKGSTLNLLDTGGMRPNDRVKQIMVMFDLLEREPLQPDQKRIIQEAIEKAYFQNKYRMDSIDQKDELGKPLVPPTLKDVVRILEEQVSGQEYGYKEYFNSIIFILKKYTKSGDDYFAQQSSISLDELLNSGLVDLDLSGLPSEEFRALGALTILQFIKEKMRAGGMTKQRGLKLIVVVDEAWKIAGDDKSDIVMIVREGRKYNFGLIVASQNPDDISKAIFSNSGTTFILKIKLPQYLDYVQSTLHFSDYMREEIEKFGQGQCLVNMAFTTPTKYPTTFIIEKVEGEEPTREYFLELEDVLTMKQKRDGAPKVMGFAKLDLKRRLVQYGVPEDKVDEITVMFEQAVPSHRLEVVNFVINLERAGVNRRNIGDFLKDAGIDDITIINIFGKVDLKRSGEEA